MRNKILLENQIAAIKLLIKLNNFLLAIMQTAAYINVIQIFLENYLEFLRNIKQNIIDIIDIAIRDNTQYKQAKNAIAKT